MITRKAVHASSADAAQLVAALAREFNVPVENVQSLYREEFERLESSARVHEFVPVLAASNTREFLRGRS
jgi:hypothetical protein